MCLEDVKIYGNNPKKLLNKIIMNNDINIIMLDFEYFNKILNSLSKKLNIIFHTISIRDVIIHKGSGINVNIIDILIQFKDRSLEVHGSKILKIFIIIFNFMRV